MKAKAMWAGLAVVVLLVMGVGGYAIYQKKYGQINWAQEAVAAELIDGESARFRNVKKHAVAGVCGEVNAKNRLGAYTGFKRFIVFGEPGDTAKVFIDDAIGPNPEISMSFSVGLCGQN